MAAVIGDRFEFETFCGSWSSYRQSFNLLKSDLERLREVFDPLYVIHDDNDFRYDESEMELIRNNIRGSCASRWLLISLFWRLVGATFMA